jgi:DNA-binding NarL/FixJ family response regulator
MLMRLLIADDHRIFAQSLASFLGNEPDIEVVGTADNGLKALQKLDIEEIDILLTDMQMPDMDGIALTLKVQESFPTVKVLMLSMIDDPTLIRSAIQVGIDGYLLKTVDNLELLKALNTIQQGGQYFQPIVMQKLTSVPSLALVDDTDYLKVLTERETEVLKLIAQEYSSPDIAEKLFISLNTVEAHRRNLFKKLNVKNSIGLIKFALRFGLIDWK